MKQIICQNEKEQVVKKTLVFVMGRTKLSREVSSKALGVPISKQMWADARKGGELLRVEKKIRKERFLEEQKKVILQWIHENTSGF